MFKKFPLVLCVALMFMCSKCFAGNLLDTPLWGKIGEGNLYTSTKGVFYNNKKPRTGNIMYGCYYNPSIEIKELGLKDIVYNVYETKYFEDDNINYVMTNNVYYDINGDVVTGFLESQKMPFDQTTSLHDGIFGKKGLTYFGIPGNGIGSFFLNPVRWKCIVGFNENVTFYDSQSVRSYEKFGEKLTDAWICFTTKRQYYTMMFVTFNHTTRSYKIYDTMVYSYGDHKLLESGNCYGKEVRVRPDSFDEAMLNVLYNLR